MSDITRFRSPRPVFKQPTNKTAIEVMTPKPRDTSPALNIIQRLREQGTLDLAAMVARAQDEARHAPFARSPPPFYSGECSPLPATPRRKSLPSPLPVQAVKGPQFNQGAPNQPPGPRLTDQEYIRQTRSIDIQSPEARAIFMSNGGEECLKSGGTYAQCWDILRMNILNRLRSQK